MWQCQHCWVFMMWQVSQGSLSSRTSREAFFSFSVFSFFSVRRRGGRKKNSVHFGWSTSEFRVRRSCFWSDFSQLFCSLTCETEQAASGQPTVVDFFEDLWDDASESFEMNQVLNVCMYTDTGSLWDVLKSREFYGEGIAKVPFSCEAHSSGAGQPGPRCHLCCPLTRHIACSLSLRVHLSEIRLTGSPCLVEWGESQERFLLNCLAQSKMLAVVILNKHLAV